MKMHFKKHTLRRILSYTAKYRAYLIFSCISALCTVLFTLLAPVLIGRAVDCILGVDNVNYTGVFYYLALLLCTVLLASASQWVLGVYTRKISSLAARDIRISAFIAINHAPLKTIDGGAHGDVISRMVNDADNVAEGLLQGITQLLPGVATIVGTLIVMAILDPIIAVLVICITPLSIAFARFITKHTSKFFKEQSAAQGRMSGFVNEMVGGQSVIKSLGAEECCYAEFDAITDQMYETGFKSVFYSSVSNPGARFVNAIVSVSVGVIGAISVVRGSMTVGQLSSFLSYANQYTKPFNDVTGVLTQLQSAQASAERLFAVIDTPCETPDANNALAPTSCEGKVDVRDVSFSYNPQTPLIEHFNLAVAPGKRIAIVGKTGCGKTTLINLLMRFYEVNAGEISVDGTPIIAMRRGALRGLYGMVLQETWLKNASVRDNIAYGKPDASLEEIIASAKQTHAHSFIKRLPNGYDTVIAPNGGNLSAGQKQLLCITRIMLCQPDMLILDEATSSIDTRTEMLVQKSFKKLMQGRTSFVVAHRLSTVQTADSILMMDAGHILEQGTHEELLAQNGAYAALYNSQFAVE